MEVTTKPQFQFLVTPSSTAVSADDRSKAISNEDSATDCESSTLAIASDVAQVSPGKMIHHFSCKDCHDLAKEPVINVICGHLFCWSCLCHRLTPPDPERRGFLQGCPFCKSNLDISPSMSTVIPVYSGPDPGVEILSPLHNPEPEPEPDEEEERKREERIRKEGKVYVPPRPGWGARSLHQSKIDLVVDMLFKINEVREAEKSFLKSRGSIAPSESLISYRKKHINELIQELKDGWRWLTGDAYPKQPEQTRERESPIYLDPTDTKLTDISTFACRICKETAFEPVVTYCGHLFCWTCLWNQTSGFSSCPVCCNTINLFASRSEINSLYCEPNDPCKEDKLLKSSRKGFRQESSAPCRPLQHVGASFLDTMIKKVIKDGNDIIDQLLNLQSRSSALLPEHLNETYLKVIKMWDKLLADLLIEWRKSTREVVKESQIKPTITDFIFDPKVISDRAYGGYWSDFIGDTLINWFSAKSKLNMLNERFEL